MAKSLKNIAAQGDQMREYIKQLPQWGETSKDEESKLDPLTAVVDSGNTYEGGLSSSSLLPPSATHTKKT
jgi:hypothetical protein